ncbi:MAG: sigma-70 family RNA polymerase sigma factor [Acidimicrobiia bacterium]|nr:sigma-70 family RNA polymerase sigma factor [Acidimicrobiia bacterium]
MAASQDHRFEELYSRHFRDVLAYCMRRGSTDDAYDAANEVFAIVWRRLDDVPATEAARPWLFVVAKRVLYRRRRGVRRFRRLVEKAGTLRQHGSPDPETVVVQRAEYEAVLEAATRLSVRDREVLNLAAWEGLPHREIAEILGCSIAAVDQRLHRAKQRLAREYHATQTQAEPRYAAGGDG